MHQKTSATCFAVIPCLVAHITEIVDETFSVLREEFGAYIVVDLVLVDVFEVTNENKELYVQAVIDYICGGAVEEQINAIVLGFTSSYHKYM